MSKPELILFKYLVNWEGYQDSDKYQSITQECFGRDFKIKHIEYIIGWLRHCPSNAVAYHGIIASYEYGLDLLRRIFSILGSCIDPTPPGRIITQNVPPDIRDWYKRQCKGDMTAISQNISWLNSYLIEHSSFNWTSRQREVCVDVFLTSSLEEAFEMRAYETDEKIAAKMHLVLGLPVNRTAVGEYLMLTMMRYWKPQMRNVMLYYSLGQSMKPGFTEMLRGLYYGTSSSSRE